MNKKFIIIVILAIIILGGYFSLRDKKVVSSLGETPTSKIPEQNNSAPKTDNTPLSKKNIINYTDTGYSPNTINIKLGATVTWKNNSSSGMWTASGMHPSHTAYSGTSLEQHCPDTANTAFDACTSILPGDSWNFTFNKIGVWKYHNHVRPSDFGTVIVE